MGCPRAQPSSALILSIPGWECLPSPPIQVDNATSNSAGTEGPSMWCSWEYRHGYSRVAAWWCSTDCIQVFKTTPHKVRQCTANEIFKKKKNTYTGVLRKAIKTIRARLDQLWSQHYRALQPEGKVPAEAQSVSWQHHPVLQCFTVSKGLHMYFSFWPPKICARSNFPCHR